MYLVSMHPSLTKKKWEEKEKKEYIRAEIKPFMAKTF